MRVLEVIDIGDTVLCDICNADHTDSDAKGGFLFGSKGICPTCVPRFEASVKKHQEESFITARSKPDETFRDFVMRIRGGNKHDHHLNI